MRHQEQPPPQQPADDMYDPERAVRHMHIGLCILKALTLPFRRWGGGIEVDGRAWALVALGFWVFFTHDLFVLYYLYAWLAGMVIYKLSTTKDRHSQFEGWPFLMLFTDSYWLATFVEVGVVLVIGYATFHVMPFVGMLVFASGLGCAGNEIAGWWMRRKEVIRYRDSQHELANQRAAYKRGR